MLGKCSSSASGLTPLWTQLPLHAAASSNLNAETASADPGANHDEQKAALAASPQTAPAEPAPDRKKRRLSQKTTQTESPKHRLSYAASWEAYIDGNVVSDTSTRYILNVLAGTAATKSEDSEDSS